MEGLSEEFTSMPDVPAENESFGQRIRNFLWDKKYIFLTGCFGSLSVVLVVYMMKQRSEHIKVLEECTVLKAEHNTLLNAVKEYTELMILHNSMKSGNAIHTHFVVKGSVKVDIINTLRSQLKELEVMLGKLISLTTK